MTDTNKAANEKKDEVGKSGIERQRRGKKQVKKWQRCQVGHRAMKGMIGSPGCDIDRGVSEIQNKHEESPVHPTLPKKERTVTAKGDEAYTETDGQTDRETVRQRERQTDRKRDRHAAK